MMRKLLTHPIAKPIIHGVPTFGAGDFGAMAFAVLATVRLPIDLLTLAEHFVRRLNARRSGT
ncbi:hypothetical protein GWC77_25910 [Paraburkholderia sp. NMBU_R16]|uniref:hypothetical protein n=1 Tax=Paraburkholderia sp. NMBU_R16 TaxID=2698676 RepID=UPI001565BA36|nr:hypothetical protein [Paraburkholderia sp. NMBU_R16]NRO99326.1 hypothetical protein [Paraburkholderia sp. NMBU_R16]